MPTWLPPPAILSRVAAWVVGGATGLLLLGVLTAPLFAWIYHKRQRIPPTRWSLLVATLAFECTPVGGLGLLAALHASTFGVGVALVAAFASAALGFPLLLLLAGAVAGRPPPGPVRDDAARGPEDQES